MLYTFYYLSLKSAYIIEIILLSFLILVKILVLMKHFRSLIGLDWGEVSVLKALTYIYTSQVIDETPIKGNLWHSSGESDDSSIKTLPWIQITLQTGSFEVEKIRVSPVVAVTSKVWNFFFCGTMKLISFLFINWLKCPFFPLFIFHDKRMELSEFPSRLWTWHDCL